MFKIQFLGIRQNVVWLKHNDEPNLEKNKIETYWSADLSRVKLLACDPVGRLTSGSPVSQRSSKMIYCNDVDHDVDPFPCIFFHGLRTMSWPTSLVLQAAEQGRQLLARGGHQDGKPLSLGRWSPSQAPQPANITCGFSRAKP